MSTYRDNPPTRANPWHCHMPHHHLLPFPPPPHSPPFPNSAMHLEHVGLPLPLLSAATPHRHPLLAAPRRVPEARRRRPSPHYDLVALHDYSRDRVGGVRSDCEPV